MAISPEVRLYVRQRARFACEYCGVSETDTGGELTIDHFHPHTKGGKDDIDNLLYCCARCNQYKADYWPETGDPVLWNPRQDAFATHFLMFNDGKLYAMTATGEFTLKRLRLNRLPLTQHRLRKQRNIEETRLLEQYRHIVDLIEQLQQQQITLLEEQRLLLEQQRALLKLLLNR
jgi:hypothetical protein